MHINTKDNPYKVNAQLVADRRQGSQRLFGAMDRLKGVPELVRAAKSELKEVVEELNAPVFSEKKAQSELVDFLNVATALALLKYGREVDTEAFFRGVNGEGKHSDIADRLEERTDDIQDNNEAIIEAIRLAHSLGTHQAGITLQALPHLFAQADHKFVSNYPEDYYGQDIEEEHQELAFRHSTKALKMVRAKVQRTLLPRDHKPHGHLIADWQNSEQALAQLKLDLEAPVIQNGIVRPSQEITAHINHTKGHGILFSAPSVRRAV